MYNPAVDLEEALQETNEPMLSEDILGQSMYTSSERDPSEVSSSDKSYQCRQVDDLAALTMNPPPTMTDDASHHPMEHLELHPLQQSHSESTQQPQQRQYNQPTEAVESTDSTTLYQLNVPLSPYNRTLTSSASPLILDTQSARNFLYPESSSTPYIDSADPPRSPSVSRLLFGSISNADDSDISKTVEQQPTHISPSDISLVPLNKITESSTLDTEEKAENNHALV